MLSILKQLLEEALELPRIGEADSDVPAIDRGTEYFCSLATVMVHHFFIKFYHERNLDRIQEDKLCKLYPLEGVQLVLA